MAPNVQPKMKAFETKSKPAEIRSSNIEAAKGNFNLYLNGGWTRGTYFCLNSRGWRYSHKLGTPRNGQNGILLNDIMTRQFYLGVSL